MGESTVVRVIAKYMKKFILVLVFMLLLGLVGDISRPDYMIPDTDIYDNISPPYILYVKSSPGLCHYWFYDTDGTIQPLLVHQLNNNQFGSMLIFERQYKILRR
jgi:hypothetical protein